MKNLSDRVFSNPLTTLIGIGFAAVGLWVLKWSDDLSEASRVFLALICFGLAITGLGWSDKTLVKLLKVLKDKVPIILMMAVSLWLTSCVSNRQILQEIRGWKLTQDSIMNTHNQIFYSYEKSRIDSVYRSMPDDELLHRIDKLTSPKSNNPHRKN
ncbi:hypothetical protein [Runella zeae]|uniref:hypothetical protein n=1 Tax=Runella zeae TaxID=94255 RepID=UPI0004246C4F|nr:hypothetical protein [Runella zeae]